MKIEGPKNIRSAAKAGSKKRASGPSGAKFSSMIQGSGGGEDEKIDGAAPTYAVSPMASLIALQEVNDEPTDREKAADYGDKLLDELENIRMGLLSGRLSYARLQSVKNMIEQKMSLPNLDAELQMVLNEIELRVRVEIAKFEKK